MNQAKKHYSYALIIGWLIISIWGIINIYSTTYTIAITKGILPRSVIMSLVAFLISFLILLFFWKKYRYVYRFLYKNTQALYYISLLLLVLVFVFGAIRGGAKSVIHFIIDIQPLEIIKITAILFLAMVFSKINKKVVLKIGNYHLGPLKKPGNLLRLAVFMMIPVGLILIQPDLGGTIIVFGIINIMFCLNGQYSKQILLIDVLLVIGFLLMAFFIQNIPGLHSYQMGRITSWLNPFLDSNNTGWGINNSLVGISNGNLLGVGYLKGVQKSFLQTGASTDYIFVTICEEWGLFGCFLTLGLIFYLSYKCFQIGRYAYNRFGMLYCYGFGLLLLLQTSVNVCGITNIIPMTGVTLPFISSGLNSYIMLSSGLFICIVIKRYSDYYYKKQNERYSGDF